MALKLQLSTGPSYSDIGSFINLSGSDIADGMPVMVDAANAISNTNTVDGIAIKVASGDGVGCIGVTRAPMPNGQGGPVRCLGPIAKLTANGAVTAGGDVMASTLGAKASAGGQHGLGIALTTAADTEDILVMLIGGKNA